MADKNSKMKLLQPSVQPFVILCIVTISLMKVPCDGAILLNCTRPDPPALLEALGPVFNLSAIRPVLNSNTPTNVTTHFTLYGILGVDEKAQILTTYIWLHFHWENEFFSWDPVQCGTDKINLPREKFWVPDVVINEFMDKNDAPFVPYVIAYSSGKLHDAKPVKVVSSCNLNIYTFPFDVQNCTLTFNSYIHRVTDVRMLLDLPVEEILKNSQRAMTTMGEWELIDITYHKYILAFEDTGIDELAFHIRVRRRATLYVVNLIIPSCFLITVDLFSFLLPPQSVDRSSFKMTLILGYTVFLLIMNDLLPVTGNTIPLLNVFLSLCMALMVASLLETILITNLLCDASWNITPVPRWVQVLVLRILGHLVFLPPKLKGKTNSVTVVDQADEKAPEERGPEVEDKALEEMRRLGKDLQAIRLQVDQQLTGNQSSEEWVQVGFIIDRLLFIFYILFIAVSFITIICIWANSYAANLAGT